MAEVPDAFISYSRADGKEFVTRLQDALDGRGKEAWVDLEAIPAASKWENELREGIAQSDCFIFVISPGSARSKHCLNELSHAAALNKRIIPLNFAPVQGDALPDPVLRHNWIPSQGCFEDDFASSLETLIGALETDLDWIREHTKWGNLAYAWDEKDRDSSLLVRGSELEEAEGWLAGQAGHTPQPTVLHRQFILASRTASTRRGRLVLAAVVAALVVSAALGVLALVQRNNAVSQKRIAIARGQAALSREFAANAVSSLGSDPALSLLLAAHAMRVDATSQAEDALRGSLSRSHLRKTFRGHQGSVNAAEYSPDGRTIITAGNDGTARLWDAARGRQIQRLISPTSLNDVSFSPNGRMVATAGSDGVARLWDVQEGKEIRALVGPPKPIEAVNFSPSGRSLITAGEDGKARLWNIASGREKAELAVPGGAVFAASFNPAGRSIVTASSDGGVRLWDLNTGRQLKLIHVPGGTTYTASFSPDGRRIVTGGLSTVQVWRPATAHRTHNFSIPGGPVEAANFSPDGRSVVASAQDGTVRVWSLDGDVLTSTLRAHKGEAWDAAFSPNGRSVVSTGTDGTVRVWDAATTKTIQLADRPRNLFFSTLSPLTRLLVTSPFHGVPTIWNAKLGRQRSVLNSHPEHLDNIAFSPGERRLATAGPNGVVRIWNTANGRQLNVLRGAAAPALALTFSPDGREILAGGHDGTALIWNVTTGQRRTVLSRPGSGVTAATFDPTRRTVALGYGDGTVTIWNLLTARKIQVVPGSGRQVFALSFDPDGTLLAIAPFGGAVRIWSTVTNRDIALLRAPTGAITQTVAFSPGGRSIVTGLQDGTARVWNPNSGKQVALLAGATGTILDARFFGPRGKAVATASEDAVVRRYACEVCGTSVQDLLHLAHRRLRGGFTVAQRGMYLRQHKPSAAESQGAHGYLGMVTTAVYPALADRLGLKTDHGALADRVLQGSPAESAGLRAGRGTIHFQNASYRVGADVVLSVDGHPLITRLDLSHYIGVLKPGDTAHMEVLRNGRKRPINVVVAARPSPR